MPPSIWVYDIETTPNLVYSWGLWQQNIGINQIVKPQDILSFAAHKIGTNKIESHNAWDDRDAMIQRLWDIMDDADLMVGYNQINFDNKHCNTAFLKAGLTPPSPYRNMDLMKVVRQKHKLPSYKLDYVCRFLGLDVKVSTGGMDLWIGCMNGEPKAQRKMLAYNRNDVRITTQLYLYLKKKKWLETSISRPLLDEDGVPRCPECGSDHFQRRGWNHSRDGKTRRFVCVQCGKWIQSGKRVPRAAMSN